MSEQHTSHLDTMFNQSTGKIFPNLESICNPFDGILLDAYGVFWGGNEKGLLPGCKEAMEKLVTEGKIVGILSNSTQLAQSEVEKLKKHGLLLGKHFHFFITSGEIAKNLFSTDSLEFPTPNKKFYLSGMPHPKFSSHLAIFQDSLYRETRELAEADFVYISVPHIDGKDQIDPLVFEKSVKFFKDIKLPMVCTNPDLFAHEGSPPRAVVRQGSIAALHEKQGGQVIYIGKPSNRMYQAAIQEFQKYSVTDLQKIVMIGDTPETDIRGAKSFGIASALIIKTGIIADRIEQQGLEKTLMSLPKTDQPNFYIEYMGAHAV